MTFNQVVIRNVSQKGNGIHLAIHPFTCTDGLHMMIHRGHYGRSDQEEMPGWKKALADNLWDGIPGLSYLFFDNGIIILHHGGVFDDDEITKAADSIIRPVLEQELALRNIG